MDDETPAEPPLDQEDDKPSRRTRWITGGAAAAVAIVGVGIAVAFSKKSISVPTVRDVNIPSLAKAVRRPLDHQVPVRQHVRRQPYGPNRSLRKEIIIPEHLRGPKAA